MNAKLVTKQSDIGPMYHSADLYINAHYTFCFALMLYSLTATITDLPVVTITPVLASFYIMKHMIENGFNHRIMFYVCIMIFLCMYTKYEPK